MRKMMLAVVAAMAMLGCGAPLTFEGNFTGLVTEVDTCQGGAPYTFDTSLLWLVHADEKAKTLAINASDPCNNITAGFSGQTGTLNPVQCKTANLGGGDALAIHIDSGTLSLDTNYDMDLNLRGSYVYSPAGGTPINCTYSQGGKLFRFE